MYLSEDAQFKILVKRIEDTINQFSRIIESKEIFDKYGLFVLVNDKEILRTASGFRSEGFDKREFIGHMLFAIKSLIGNDMMLKLFVMECLNLDISLESINFGKDKQVYKISKEGANISHE